MKIKLDSDLLRELVQESGVEQITHAMGKKAA
jgi:hypothetical protein